MKIKSIENLHHSDECSGTLVVINDQGQEYRAHWTEGYSNVAICEGGIKGSLVGVIHANGETTHDNWEAFKPLLEEPGVNARPMTIEEEKDHEGAMASI